MGGRYAVGFAGLLAATALASAQPAVTFTYTKAPAEYVGKVGDPPETIHKPGKIFAQATVTVPAGTPQPGVDVLFMKAGGGLVRNGIGTKFEAVAGQPGTYAMSFELAATGAASGHLHNGSYDVWCLLTVKDANGNDRKWLAPVHKGVTVANSTLAGNPPAPWGTVSNSGLGGNPASANGEWSVTDPDADRVGPVKLFVYPPGGGYQIAEYNTTTLPPDPVGQPGQPPPRPARAGTWNFTEPAGGTGGMSLATMSIKKGPATPQRVAAAWK